VLPGQLLQGHMSAKIAFPQWLGNFSKGNKHQRLLQELHSHSGLKYASCDPRVSHVISLLSCRTSCNRSELGMEYLQHFHYHTTKPLLDDVSIIIYEDFNVTNRVGVVSLENVLLSEVVQM